MEFVALSTDVLNTLAKEDMFETNVSGRESSVFHATRTPKSGKLTSSTRIQQGNRVNIGWAYGPKGMNVKSLTVMDYLSPNTVIQTCTVGGVNGPSFKGAIQAFKPSTVKRVVITCYFI